MSNNNGKVLVARLVVRDGGENDGLILGILMRGGENVLRRGMVYDVVAWSPTMSEVTCDEVSIVEVGPSCIPRTIDKRAAGQTSSVCWGNGIEDIVEGMARGWCLTIVEYADILNREGADG